MKFCSQCQNMCYLSIDDNNANELLYYCRVCGHKNTHLTQEGVVVLKTQLKKSEQKFNHMVNKYTKYDPTLPRRNNMKCPSAECSKKEGDDNDVIYLRYDDDNMKYLYICAYCDATWKTDDNK